MVWLAPPNLAHQVRGISMIHLHVTTNVVVGDNPVKYAPEMSKDSILSATEGLNPVANGANVADPCIHSLTEKIIELTPAWFPADLSIDEYTQGVNPAPVKGIVVWFSLPTIYAPSFASRVTEPNNSCVSSNVPGGNLSSRT
jgi:hypothetical protein